MSLVGSLEDLSLGDILQIISLSQKSGVLALKTTGCDGRIVFVNGLVRGAGIKGGPQDLRGVLVGGGFLSDDEFTAAVEHAEHGDRSVPAAIAEICSLSQERVDSLCREAIESAVVEMFSWHTGDFSFDVRSDAEPDDPELLLPTGINAQYLAMEGARVEDEDHQSGESDSAGIDEMSAHDFFGVADEPAGDDDDTVHFGRASGHDNQEAAETLAVAAAQQWEDEDVSEADLLSAPHDSDEDVPYAEVHPIEDPAPGEAEQPILAAEPVHSTESMDLDAREPVEEGGPSAAADQPVANAAPAADCSPAAGAQSATGALPAAGAPPAAGAQPATGAQVRPLVALDDELPALEWLKGAVKHDYSPIHIFQHTDQALQRVRQYLVRGQPPVILISPSMHVDRLGGIRDAVDLVARLKSQSAKVTVLWLCEEGSGGTTRMGTADGMLTRPDVTRLLGLKRDELERLASEFAQKLRIDVAGAASPEVAAASPAARREISPDAIRKLRDATRALTEAGSRGEVLPLVIRFAAEVFRRVAMFMVREGRVVGMAGQGLERAGGPDDAGLREISIDPAESLWMRSVLKHGKPIQGTVDSPGDRMLVALLGDRPPPSVYMAPIESTGQVIALLYGDNLPDEDPIGDTSALEVVLHHAGLALDRAALERALRDDDS